MDTYIGDIIDSQRNDTRNGDTEAIATDEFVRFNNAAQRYLFGRITLTYNYAFEKVGDAITTTANEDTYSIDDNLAFGTRITTVWYRPNGIANSEYRLRPTPNRPDRLIQGTRPRYYRRRKGQIILEPAPDNANDTIVPVYERALDTLDIRRARINGTPSSTDITIDAPTAAEAAYFVENTYLCVSDAFGTPLLYNGIISSYSSNVITLTDNVSNYLQTGVALADLDNAYITLGKYTTTHSELPNEAEDYFVEWVNRKLHNIDSSEQFAETDQILTELRDTIVASYYIPDKDVKDFPVSDFDLLIPGYE